MALRPIATEIEQTEFHLTCNRHDRGQDEYLTGVVKGFARAMQRARGLASVGWRVTMVCLDPHRQEPKYTLEPSL